MCGRRSPKEDVVPKESSEVNLTGVHNSTLGPFDRRRFSTGTSEPPVFAWAEADSDSHAHGDQPEYPMKTVEIYQRVEAV